jgi:hypothetical protein
MTAYSSEKTLTLNDSAQIARGIVVLKYISNNDECKDELSYLSIDGQSSSYLLNFPLNYKFEECHYTLDPMVVIRLSRAIGGLYPALIKLVFDDSKPQSLELPIAIRNTRNGDYLTFPEVRSQEILKVLGNESIINLNL